MKPWSALLLCALGSAWWRMRGMRPLHSFWDSRLLEAYQSEAGILLSVTANNSGLSSGGSAVAFRSSATYLIPFHADAANWGFLWLNYSKDIACGYYKNTGTAFRRNSKNETDRCGRVPGLKLDDPILFPGVVPAVLLRDSTPPLPTFDQGHRWNEIVLDRTVGPAEKPIGKAWPLVTGGPPQANVFFMCCQNSSRFGDRFNKTRDLENLRRRSASPVLGRLPVLMYNYCLHDTTQCFNPLQGSWHALKTLEQRWQGSTNAAC